MFIDAKNKQIWHDRFHKQNETTEIIKQAKTQKPHDQGTPKVVP